MRGRDKALIAMALTMVMMLSGCSSSQTDNLLDSGIKYIQDHEYQKAKETLEKALSGLLAFALWSRAIMIVL